MTGLTAAGMDFSGSVNAGVYAEQAAAAQDAYAKAQASIQSKRDDLNNQSGYSVQNNPDGSIANFSVDGLNPVGKYQQMQKMQGVGLERQHEQDMARGIGGKGIGSQNDSLLRYGNAVNQANFGNSFMEANQGLVDAGTGAFGTYQNSLLNLQLQAIADARTDQMFPKLAAPAAGGGANTPLAPGSGASVAPPNPVGNGFFGVTADSVMPTNVNAKTIHVGGVADVDPKMIAIAQQIEAAKAAAAGAPAEAPAPAPNPVANGFAGATSASTMPSNSRAKSVLSVPGRDVDGRLTAIAAQVAAANNPGAANTETNNPSAPATQDDSNGWAQATADSVSPQNPNAETIRVGSTSDVDPRIASIVAQIAAANKAAAAKDAADAAAKKKATTPAANAGQVARNNRFG